MIPAIVVNTLAVIGALFVTSTVLLLLWIWANERAGRRHERAAKQLSGGWR